MAYEEHAKSAADIIARCAVITLSDTRDEKTDKSGARIRELLIEQGHAIASHQILPDDPARLRTALQLLLADAAIDAILTNGGTGISARDQTIDVIAQNLQTRLDGFGELFRMLSWEQIGSGAMMSRAIAGIACGKVIFAMPGSTKAVELAMNRLILPEICHILFELRK
jgi:molybdenum cofactor biosynthesis protein B